VSQPTPEPTAPAPSEGSRVRYREDLRAPWWLWLLGLGFALTMGIAFLPLHPLAGLGGLLVGAALAVFGIIRWTLVLEVADGTLRVGRARVPVRLLGEARALDAPAMRQERGPRLDARAYLAMRGWAPGGVRVAVRDPADPTPYWLVSSRRPEEFAAAIRAATSGNPAADRGATG